MAFNSIITLVTLTMQVSPGAGGSVTPLGGAYQSGTVVPISETPNTGYTFNGWIGTGTGSYTGSSASPSVTMTNSITEIANYLAPVTVSTYSSPSGDGTVSGGGSYASGSTATISETPATGYSLSSWTCTGDASSACPSGSGTSSFGFAVATGASVTANFAVTPACTSGGGLVCTETTNGIYTIDTFTYSSDVGSWIWTVPSHLTTVDYLVVGGGAGGAVGGAGGGGGGTANAINYPVTQGTAMTIVVGAGGYAGGGAGGASQFGSITAQGSSGSTSGNGYVAGAGAYHSGSLVCYGGGGGAGGGGGNSGGGNCGTGGPGISSTLTGSTVYYGGGGGASGYECGSGSAGGIGGGGAGCLGCPAGSGSPNTGGAGGNGGCGNGCSPGGTTPGSGGSGIVILRYIKPS